MPRTLQTRLRLGTMACLFAFGGFAAAGNAFAQAGSCGGVAGYPVSLEAALQVGHATLPSGEEIAGGPQPTANASVPNPAFEGGFFITADSTVTNQYSAWYGNASSIYTI